MSLAVEAERETDGRWIAEIPQIPGAMAYGATLEEAVARAEALGLRVLAERIEHGETSPEIEQVFSVTALHESVGFREGAPSLGGLAERRMEH